MPEMPREEVIGGGGPFQPGDVVECILGDSSVNSPCDGEQFIVEWVYCNAGEVYVRLQPDPRLSAHLRGGWYAHRFRLVKAAPKTEVTSGGPYIAVSVYEAVIKERDCLKGDVDILKKIITDLKTERSQMDDEMRRVRAAAATAIKEAAASIPNPLPQPLPPAWLRSKWWYAMDRDGDWYAYMEKPCIDPYEDQWRSSNPLGNDYQKIESVFMGSANIPPVRWKEACWQVT